LSYSTAGTSGSLHDTTSLLPSTSSSIALAGGLLAPDLSSFHNAPDWNAFSTSESQYLGDGQLLSGGPNFFTTTEDNINVLAMSSGMGTFDDANTSIPMMKGKHS
jgi:hypothetical protein